MLTPKSLDSGVVSPIVMTSPTQLQLKLKCFIKATGVFLAVAPEMWLPDGNPDLEQAWMNPACNKSP